MLIDFTINIIIIIKDISIAHLSPGGAQGASHSIRMKYYITYEYIHAIIYI